jgi:hypothetical protein
MLMPTFIDESGDVGPMNKGGKAYFRLAALWIPTHDIANSFRDNIRGLRRELGLREGYEFKFSETHHCPSRRERFFAVALDHDFHFAISSIDKREEYWERAGREEQHSVCATDLAAALRPVYCRAEEQAGRLLKDVIAVDDNRDSKYLAVIKSKFRGLKSPLREGTSLVGKVFFHDSSADEALQLADMICGAMGDSNPHWPNLIADRQLP